MSTFREAVADVQSLFVGATHEVFMTHRARLDEAERVEPCVVRAVYGELDPTGYRAVGRPTKFSPPGLGEYLATKGRYTRDDPVAAAAIADATRNVMALGWLFCCTPEVEVADRTARDIWDFWAGPSLRDPLDQIVPKKLARLIHDRGAGMLVAELKTAGLMRRGSSTVRQIGYQIVQHGFYLRMVQSLEITETSFRAAVSARRSSGPGPAGGRWEWGAYPDNEMATPPLFSKTPERAPLTEWSERRLTESIPECYVGDRDQPHVRAAVVLHQDLALLLAASPIAASRDA